MIRIGVCCCAAALLAKPPVSAQATLHLSVPVNTPGSASLYVAGTFNNWSPAAPGYTLASQGGGVYAITLPASVRGPIEFKFTLGSWDKVELDSAGHDVPNRKFAVPDSGAAMYTGSVGAWRDGSPRTPPPHSASPSVTILDSDFAMPQLHRTRRVWIYLPPDYATSGKRYPVLYMHDGQNLFDAATGFAGEWGVDETLDSLAARGARGTIVVGVDNGQEHRMDEYDPWPTQGHGGGEGDAYVDFLAHTLKPYIDQHYRTRPDRLHTGIAGSSMGGLISFYAALKYPDVFGLAGVFSPSLWIAPSLYTLARQAHPRPGTRIYMLMGGKEGDTPERYVRDFQQMADTLGAAGFTTGSAVQTALRPDGTHAEWFWRREFPAAYEWLFQDAPTRRGPVAATWTHGAVCYEIFVRSFYDSNGDGTGDLNGVIQKLGYVKGLGASCIWLMPVAKSPSYHGYDVSDYYNVEPAYGTNDDFKRLVKEAHRQGIAVLVDMVLNHTSSENPWFQAALHDTTSPYRSWYRFSPTYLGKGPWGADAWHKSPVRDEYFYGVFWSGMPDLNYQTPAVAQEANKIADFWLRDMGVDGFRLDAVPYMVEEGSCLMGCAGTHTMLRDYSEHIQSVKPDVYTVGEVWANIDAMLPYYPDQLTSYFGFELADSLVSAVRSGSPGGFLSGFLRLQDTMPPYRWSPFLSNHDGTRVMTLLGGDVAKAKVAATLLLTLPGLPFIYYGEEVGMTGDKPDERLRTPMQWSAHSGVGFTTGKPWEAPQADSLTVNVALEDADPASLLILYRRLIHLRKNNEALATGKLVPLTSSSPQVAAFLRRSGGQAVMVVANLGAAAVPEISIGSAPGVLPPGRYTLRNTLGGPAGSVVEVLADGSIRGQLAPPSLGPRECLVLEFVHR